MLSFGHADASAQSLFDSAMATGNKYLGDYEINLVSFMSIVVVKPLSN